MTIENVRRWVSGGVMSSTADDGRAKTLVDTYDPVMASPETTPAHTVVISQHIKDMYTAGDKIQAIKLLRDQTGWSLVETKRALDAATATASQEPEVIRLARENVQSGEGLSLEEARIFLSAVLAHPNVISALLMPEGAENIRYAINEVHTGYFLERYEVVDVLEEYDVLIETLLGRQKRQIRQDIERLERELQSAKERLAQL